MIVLKHLAREFNLNPSRMRRILRDEFGKHKRWQWAKDDPELQAIRDFLSSMASKTKKPSSVSSHATATHSRSISRRSDGSTLH